MLKFCEQQKRFDFVFVILFSFPSCQIFSHLTMMVKIKTAQQKLFYTFIYLQFTFFRSKTTL